MTGNEIEDPCFSTSLSASSVVCPDAPWKNTGIEIRLTKPLPLRYAGLRGRTQPNLAAGLPANIERTPTG